MIYIKRFNDSFLGSQPPIPPSSPAETISVDDSPTSNQERDKPAQEKCKAKITQLQSQLSSLLSLKNSGMSSVTNKQVKDVKEQLHNEEMRLKKYEMFNFSG